MSTEPIFPDLSALTARLRKEDRQFRDSFALGKLDDKDGKPDPASALPMMAPVIPPAPPPASTGLSLPSLTEIAAGVELRSRLLALIEQRTGIEAATGAGERLDRLLRTMPAAGVAPWLNTLEAEPTEGLHWTELIDALTVHETYFFRDPDQLDFIRRHVLAALIEAGKGPGRVRLACWCAGCSSGEEVYSLTILILEALREAGEAEIRGDGRILINPRWRISVLGTDIDRAELRKAQSASYADFPMGPFRSLPEPLFSYFEPPERGKAGEPARRTLRPEIRAVTSFQPFNLADLEPPERDFNLILCRNVLIYLSDRTRLHAQALFHRALARDGVLALGPTDVLRQATLYQPVWGPATVLYRKKELNR
ncbi:MAG: CheR family methyltransferase [Rhodospirillaceae bacterium]